MKNLIFNIKAFSQLLILEVKEWIYNQGRTRSFERAKKVARRKFAIDGKTYYVVQGEKWVFFVGNSLEIDKLKRIRVFSKNLNIKTLNEICCFKVGATCKEGNDYSALRLVQ